MLLLYTVCVVKQGQSLYNGVLLLSLFFLTFNTKRLRKKMNLMFQATKVWRNQSQWHFCVVNSTFIFTFIYGFCKHWNKTIKEFVQMYNRLHISISVGQMQLCISSCIISTTHGSFLEFVACPSFCTCSLSLSRIAQAWSCRRYSGRSRHIILMLLSHW